ncbi:MAG: AbrB/MazE/SpoVT family DNA-binding domain-containing protein [Candidatus Rokuibacteriota bacterium]
MPTSTITSKGQITIPKAVRERLDWRTGDRLDFTVEASGRVIVELATGDIRELRGLLHRPGRKAVSVEEMNETIRRSAAAGFAGAESRRR